MTENVKITLQSTILRLLSNPNVDKRLGSGRYYFTEAVINEYPRGTRPSEHLVMQTLWSLIGKGLTYIDIRQSAPENWEWRLTDAGNAAEKDEQFNPDDPERYMSRLRGNRVST
jgi:hypothetical protein